ncbi:Signal transduction histidine kinase CheA [Chitinispirillum alkaliphilum]|nr:Signal transduction histidine kinase CheA [Chitinispirillum alkaliphilum]
MFDSSEGGYLKANTILFAQNVCKSIEDMIGVQFTLWKESLRESAFTTKYSMIAYIHFSGSIQGDYLLAIDEILALKMIGAYEEGMSEDSIRQLREEYSGFIKELLNLSVGQSIVELEKSFGDLTFSPSTVVYGEIEFPDILSGNVDLDGKDGRIQCGFAVNLANLKIGQKLEEALHELEQKATEAMESKRNIQNMLELLPTGLLSINSKGLILPGYSKATPASVGYTEEQSITSQPFTTIAGVPEELAVNWINWLDMLFEKYGVLPFKDMAELCDLNEFQNTRGRYLKCNWLPVENEENNTLDKLLVVVEDITKQKELEKQAEVLNRRHQDNLDLISQVINLQPDEVTDFVYDSSELLQDAQTLVKGNHRDREFINGLFRTFHTLKGSSGQYRFKQLQEMAHSVEDYLKAIRDHEDSIDEDTIVKISESIEDARGYINRIQDLRSKLGGKEETLKEKAVRDPHTVMVKLGSINEISKSLKQVIKKGEMQNLDQYYLQELRDTHGKVSHLTKINISFFLSSFESLVQNTSAKVNKKVSLTLNGDGEIDIEDMRKLHHCLIHLINNAIDHGIETPEQRKKLGKIESGMLILDCSNQKECIEISLEDDGKGINLEAVKNKVASTHNLEIEEVEKMSEQELYRYLFVPGFSTKDTVSETSGRGVGMDFVHHTVSKLGGSINISSTPGKGTKTTISLPM